jgi:type IV secretory pathway TrbF-like protein
MESRMDMKETSAMTEASGLTSEQTRPLQSPPQDATIIWAERLGQVTAKAPLQALFVAFLLGMWVARRR